MGMAWGVDGKIFFSDCGSLFAAFYPLPLDSLYFNMTPQ